MKVLTKSMEVTLSSDDVEVQAESSGAATGGSTCLVANFLQYRESLACPDQDQVVCQNDKTRITQSIDQQHRETSGSLAEAFSVIGSASVSSDPDSSVTCKSKGAIPKKTRSRLKKSSANVLKVTKAKDSNGFVGLFLHKCITEHNDYLQRMDDVEAYLKFQTHERKEKALKAVSRGFWGGSVLSDIWKLVSDRNFINIGGDGLFQKLMQFYEADAFIEGISPWFDEARKIPFFERCKDEEGRVCFILGKDRLPSKAIQACREQPIVSGLYGFFQVLIYETVLEIVGEKVFDWYYGRHDTRLQLVAEKEMQHIHKLTVPPIISIIASGNKSKDKIGKIKKWENLEFTDQYYIDKLDISYGICIDVREGEYLVPGVGKIRRVNVGGEVALYKVSKTDEDPHLLMSKDARKAILETEFQLDWGEIVKMKRMYRDYIGKFEHDQSQRAPEERQPRRRRKIKPSFPGVPEQSSVNFPEQ